MKSIIISFLLIFSVSCLKTTEQLNREKKFDSMSEQLSDSQNLLSDVLTQVKEMQSQVDKLNGRVEEIEFKSKNNNSVDMTKLNEELALLKSQKEADSLQLSEIKTQLSEQKKFLEQVTDSLSKLGTSKIEAKKIKKKSTKEELSEAQNLISKKKYEDAKVILLSLIDSNETAPGDTNKALHALGKIEFESKNFDKALIYFSKIYSKYPKASLAPSSLLFIGKSLKGLGKNSEAKEAFAKVSEDYPTSKESGEAKKEL